MEDAWGFTATIDAELTVRFISSGVERHLGLRVDDLVGASFASYVHPADLDRALLHVTGWGLFGAPGGVTSFRLQDAEGGWTSFDITASHVTDGTEDFLAVDCRPVDHQQATEEILRLLLAGADRSDVMEQVLDLFAWKPNGTAVAIAWYEPDVGHRMVSTGIPAELAGAQPDPSEPWATARTLMEPVLDIEMHALDAATTALALEHGRGGVWVVPLADPSGPIPALLSIWGRTDGPRPDGHAYGMSLASNYIELILRWTSHVDQLDIAARRDPLTGLGNRRALFDALASGPGGAVLYCDLDHFKTANDRLGHAGGDAILQEVAARFASAVRAADLVARTGGDEFVVVARELDHEQAEAMAERIQAAMAEPMTSTGDPVEIGVTIGIHVDPTRLDASSVDHADRALMDAKARRRGSIGWSPTSELRRPAAP